MAAGDLYSAATELLSVAASVLNSETSAGAPDRQYVSVGPPVYDFCPQLTVHWQTGDLERMQEIGRQSLPQMRPAVPMMALVVTTIRCYPIIEGGVDIVIPSVAALADAGSQVYADGWAMLNGLRSRSRANALFSGRYCRSVDFGLLTPTATQGGAAGSQVLCLVELDGYTVP